MKGFGNKDREKEIWQTNGEEEKGRGEDKGKARPTKTQKGE